MTDFAGSYTRSSTAPIAPSNKPATAIERLDNIFILSGINGAFLAALPSS